MAIIYSDHEIESLADEHKIFGPGDWYNRTRLRPKRGHFERHMDVAGIATSQFRLIFRQSNRKVLVRFGDVCDKQFSSLTLNREGITRLVDEASPHKHELWGRAERANVTFSNIPRESSIVNMVGQPEGHTQCRVIEYFRDILGYTYLGNWEKPSPATAMSSESGSPIG